MGDVWTNRQSGDNFFLRYNSAKLLAHLINFMNRRCHVNPKCSNIHPANLIRLAYSRYKHVRANNLAQMCYFRQYILFTSRIGKAVRRGGALPIRQDIAY
jgi:hypothetical protein